MTAQTANEVTVPVGSDGWNPTTHIKQAFESARIIIPVADQAERDGLPARFPGGVLPIPTVVHRADVGALEIWDGTRWVLDQRTKRKFVAGTSTGSLATTDGWISIAAAYTTPVSPYGAGVPYEIEVSAQAAPTNGTGGTTALRVLFNGVAADGGQGQTTGSSSTVGVQGSKYVADGSAQTVTVQVSALTANATLSGGNSIYWYKVLMRPVVNL